MTSNFTEINFDARRAMQLYVAGEHDALSAYLLDILGKLKELRWPVMTPAVQRFVNAFVTSFGALFTQQDYVLSDQDAIRFISFNPDIANLVALSPMATTDQWLEILRDQKANFAKILTLLNARCGSTFAVEDIYSAERSAASTWYQVYFELFHTGMPTKVMWDNARRHLEQADSRAVYVGPLTGHEYFFLSYIDFVHEARLKQVYHRLVKPVMAGIKVVNRPNPRSIAIVTGRWTRTSAVYKSLAPFVEALKDRFDLTLVNLRGPYHYGLDFDKSWFKSIRTVSRAGANLDASEILDNDFACAYFPDVGMLPEDRHLCNLRFAPIQAMGYGHPVSTHGAEIDYVIGGLEVERIEEAAENYSERLVLIPGLGAFPVLPPEVIPGAAPPVGGRLVINCPWSGYKCNYPHLLRLRRIAEQTGIPVVFRFFVGQTLTMRNQQIIFFKALEDTVGKDRIEVIEEKPYPIYQQLLREGALSLDSHAFGGYNTVVDCIALGQPVVTLQGNQAANRLASAVLRRVGLKELVATNEEEYVSIASRLILDAPYRARLRERLAKIVLREVLCRAEEPQAFRRAIEFLIRNHARLQAEGSRDPIVVR